MPESRFEHYDRRSTYVRKARSYLTRASAWMHADLPLDPGYGDLMEQCVTTAHEILAEMPDDFFETTQSEGFFGLPGGPVNLSDTVAEQIEKLDEALLRRRSAANRQRRAKLLANVEGRTPEEAEAYLAKAEQMREES